MKREPDRHPVDSPRKAASQQGTRREHARRIASICCIPQEERTPGPDDLVNLAELTEYLTELRDGLGPFYDLLLREPLPDGQLRSRSARLFATAPQFVRATARMLADDPDLFPEIPTDQKLLVLLQGLSDILRSLTCHFQVLARLCGDTYIDVQSEAIKQAGAVVKAVRQDRKMVFNRPPRMMERWLAMAVVDLYAPTRATGGKGKKGRGKGKKGE